MPLGFGLSLSLPKNVAAPLSPCDLRPIALEQVQLKCIHRLLVSLLKLWWSQNILYASQFGFFEWPAHERLSCRCRAVCLAVCGFKDDVAIFSRDMVNVFGFLPGSWIRRVFVACGASAEWLHALDQWLLAGSCKILWKRLIFDGFGISSGVPQGDPLSLLSLLLFLTHLVGTLPCVCPRLVTL